YVFKKILFIFRLLILQSLQKVNTFDRFSAPITLAVQSKYKPSSETKFAECFQEIDAIKGETYQSLNDNIKNTDSTNEFATIECLQEIDAIQGKEFQSFNIDDTDNVLQNSFEWNTASESSDKEIFKENPEVNLSNGSRKIVCDSEITERDVNFENSVKTQNAIVKKVTMDKFAFLYDEYTYYSADLFGAYVEYEPETLKSVNVNIETKTSQKSGIEPINSITLCVDTKTGESSESVFDSAEEISKSIELSTKKESKETEVSFDKYRNKAIEDYDVYRRIDSVMDEFPKNQDNTKHGLTAIFDSKIAQDINNIVIKDSSNSEKGIENIFSVFSDNDEVMMK
ncbi:hypothetical protein HK096_005656, partial [Nowakowskiella sp. JEL0078]